MKDLGKLINKMIDKAVLGCDKYVHNHSTWLIFTDEKKWVIELTKDGTLWYNYDFFKNLFKVLSLDVVENQHYITKWVEDTIINGVKNTTFVYHPRIDVVEETIINGVNYTGSNTRDECHQVEDTIQNGVKETHSGCDLLVDDYIEDTIQNGVKETKNAMRTPNIIIEDTIQNGVKHTIDTTHHKNKYVEDAIKNGVKHTEYGDWLDGDERFDDIIQNGVKHTVASDCLPSVFVEDTIENGVKETWGYEKQPQKRIDDVIMNGQKD